MNSSILLNWRDEMKERIKIKKPKRRNLLVPLSMRRKAGVHKKSNKAIRREEKQKINDLL
jgi:hypothetical protein